MMLMQAQHARGVAAMMGLAIVASCGGGGDKPAGPPPVPDNTPSVVSLSPTAPLSLMSGSTATVIAIVLAKDGRQLSGVAVAWSSSDAAVARVQDGVITASRVGSATITASAGGITSSGLATTVTPGAPAQLALRVQPAGAIVAAPFTVQPVAEIRDGAGNVVTASTLPVSVAVASGGGTLVGTTTVSAVAGVATFTGLSLTGIAGNRVLTLSATGLVPVSSSPFALSPGAAVRMVITGQPIGGAIGAPLLSQPVVELRDVSDNVASGSATAVTASISFGGGAVLGTATVAADGGVAVFHDLAISGSIGDREMTFSAAGVTPVSSARFTLALIVFGLPGQKIQILDVGTSITPTSSAAAAPIFESRAPSRASVDNAGRITAQGEGQTWIVSSLSGGSDSILAIVPRSVGGPVLRTDLATYTARSGDPTTVDLVLDPRSVPVGAASIYVTAFFESADFHGTVSQLQPAGAQVVMNQPTSGVYRFSVASPTGISTPIAFGRLQFTAGPFGETLTINVSAADAFGPDGTNLLSRITSTYYTVTFR